MKRLIPLALACLLLCGCGNNALTQPPKDSFISGTPRVEFADGKISAMDITTVDAKDSTRQYIYQQQGNTCFFTEKQTENATKGVLTYGEYRKAVDLVLKKLQANDLLLDGPQQEAWQSPTITSQVLTYQRGNAMTARTVRASMRGSSTNQGTFRGYFVYTIGSDDFVGGAQGFIQDNGETPAAFLVLSQSYVIPADGGGSTNHRECVYIFLMK